MRPLIALALAAVALSGCASALPDAQALSAAGGNADVLKEVNRHIELCHRTYTLGWPFSGVVDCPAQTPAVAAPVTAAQIQAMIDGALAKLAPPK